MTDLAGSVVGRERELEVVEQLLDGACAGEARILCVAGEPGIGKTRLLAEVAARAGQRGCLVLEGGTAEFEGELPFGVLVDALEEHLESLAPSAYQRLATEDLGELAGVFPALRSLDPKSDQPTTAAERFRAHRAVCALLEHLAVSRPLLLGLDDLHWADGASLELVSHLLRRRPRAALLVAVAFRRGQVDRALESTIQRGLRETDAWIDLGPLPRAEAQTLVAGAGPADYGSLYEASGGNPFYLLELARMGMQGERPWTAGDVAGVPDAVALATVGELEALSPRARRLAQVAAVAGDPFELDLALATAEMSEADVLDGLDELLDSDMVRSTSVPRRFRFRHPLVRRAVYEACPPGSRIATHHRSARALEARRAPASARAHHVEHSARHGDMAAVSVLRDAGRSASTRAPESAARWFAAALSLLPERDRDPERLELLTQLAASQAATGRLEESRDSLLESIDLTAGGNTTTRVQLVGAVAGIEQMLGHHEKARARLTAALAELSDTSSTEAVELMLHLASGDFYRMDYDGMRRWGTRALGVAESLGPSHTAASLAVLAVAAALDGPIGEAEARRAQAAVLVDALNDEQLVDRLDAVATLSAADLYLHRYESAAGHARRGLAIARTAGRGELVPFLVPVLVTVLHTNGQIGEAAELLGEAVDAARLSRNAEALGWNLLSQAYVAVAAGDLDLALSAAQESVEATRALDDRLVHTYARWAFASALLESGDSRAAIDVLLTTAGGEELPRIPLGWRPHYFELMTRSWLGHERLAEGRVAAGWAAASAQQVGLEAGTAVAGRAAAAVALAAGDGGTAAELALAAAGAFDAIGARVDGARARTLAGRALMATGEREAAAAELERAARALDSYGARRYCDEAEHELRRLGRRFGRRTRASRPDGQGVETLTQRELEVAQLVVERRTNPEIAHALVLSEKTIETHLRNIFRKLGVSSRFDVARAVESAVPGSAPPSPHRGRSHRSISPPAKPPGP